MKYANLHGYSDVVPYEIIKITAKTIVVRAMRAKRLTDPIFVPGGFAGHCTNQREIEYEITSDPHGAVLRAHLRADGHYHSPFGKHILSEKPRYFYDYNF